MAQDIPAPRNRTLRLSDKERSHFQTKLVKLSQPATVEAVLNRTLCQDLFDVLDYLPSNFVDLLFLDPPYNLNKQFRQFRVQQQSSQDYANWITTWLAALVRVLKPTASIYFCCDWYSSTAVYSVIEQQFKIRNRITWEREKGRAAKSNWKNCAEDIWFCTVADEYYFDAQAVRLKRQVRAPYRDVHGTPKDWQSTRQGNFRLTAASNLWTDLTVPFWSMPENTEHPTQKPEKLLAKVILASCPADGVVLDPFLGSGTTSVVAKKLGRQFVGIEMDAHYACLAEKRLALADTDTRIQGYCDRTFWERNTFNKNQ